MKKIFLLIISFFYIQIASAEVIEAGVSIDDVPKPLFGTWRVIGSMESSNSYESFKSKSMDFWELSRRDNIITLFNPHNGAKDDISVNTVEGNLIVFTRKIEYDNNKVLTDTVTIRLNGNEFTGLNDLKLEMFSLIDGHLMSTKTARYSIKGEKIAGDSVLIEPASLTPESNF